MTKAQTTTVVEEAARLLRENPSWKYYECINRAKEIITNERNEVSHRRRQNS